MKRYPFRMYVWSVFIFIPVLFSAIDTQARPADNDREKTDITGEDIGITLDKAIKVLSVIREELKEEDTEKKDAEAQYHERTEKESLAIETGKWIARINRIWRNLKEVVSEEDAPRPGTVDKDIIDAAAINERLTQAIGMMSTIKAELERTAEEHEEKEEDGT